MWLSLPIACSAPASAGAAWHLIDIIPTVQTLCLNLIQAFLETTHHIAKNQTLYLPIATKIVPNWNTISVVSPDSVLSENALYAIA